MISNTWGLWSGCVSGGLMTKSSVGVTWGWPGGEEEEEEEGQLKVSGSN